MKKFGKTHGADMVRKDGQYLVKHYNTWCVEMTIPKDLRKHFPHVPGGKKNLQGRFKTKLAKSLGTSDFVFAEIEKHRYIYQRKKLFKSYRSGEAIPETINDLAKRWKAQLERSNYSTSTLERAVLETLPLEDQQNVTQENLADLVSQIPENAVAAFQKSPGALCALEDHVDDFIASHSYSLAVGEAHGVLSKNVSLNIFPLLNESQPQRSKRI